MSQNSNPLPTNDKEASLHQREQESPEQPERELRPLNPSSFRQLYWIFMPVLAIVSYISVLRIGFLSDDFVLLSAAASARSPFNAFIFDPSTYFYRPIGQSLTWELGWQLWGFNPLPYHLVGLLLHAGIATLLGLWLAEVFQRRAVGWLAGALFAVFPLHAEAVGWLADQWDLWAALFTLLSLFLFTKWWRNPTNNRRYWYSLSLALFVLGRAP